MDFSRGLKGITQAEAIVNGNNFELSRVVIEPQRVKVLLMEVYGAPQIVRIQL